MPKNMKIKIEDLKVQSFVTTVVDKEKNKLNGGFSGNEGTDCEPYNDVSIDCGTGGTIDTGPFVPGCDSFACTGLTCAFCNPTDFPCG